MIFLLSFAVFGASGKERPFPTVSCAYRGIGSSTNASPSGPETLPPAMWTTATAMAHWIKRG